MVSKKRVPAKKQTAKKKTSTKRKVAKKATTAAKGETTSPASETKKSNSFPIVGVGASAGGLEAFEKFLKQVPTDTGMAFVLVQHLDPVHKSILAELVKRVTPMEVFEVTNGMQVKPNCAYIIPPNRDMAFLHGKLTLIEPTAPRGLRLPIDFFLRSLAQDQEERAICVILSGTGSDGTLGLKAVKEEGGMVIAQEPKTAKYDGMPRSAIASGLVDYVLPPEEMVAQLQVYTKYAFGKQAKRLPSPSQKKSDELNKIYILLRNQTGHDFSYYKPNTILRRIERRMNLNQIGRLSDYVRHLQNNSLEIETLFKELLIGVSNFFRDPQAFEALREKVIPALFKDKPLDEPVRVWVTGCATGEEAYSIAMLLREQMDSIGKEYKLQVFATDIDSNAIECARSGVYPDSIAVDVPPQYLSRFFIKQENTYQVSKAVRDCLVFSEQNVIKDPPFSRLDLLSCRNLLIYMEGELQKRLLPLFHYALRKDGYMFLGSSETIGEATDLFKIIDRKWKIFQCKVSTLPHSAGINLTTAPFPLDMDNRNNMAGGVEIRPIKPLSSRELTEHLLLEKYAPACVLVSEKGEGLFFYGQTGKYLQPPAGDASWNIVGLAREGLRLDLTTALRKVATHKKPVRFENVEVKTSEHTQVINLAVTPMPEQPGQGATLMVAFEDVVSKKTEERAEISEPSVAANQRVSDLERELRSTKEYLQTTIEELETSNEELKSTNEELQSSNEELQSTNEELETSKEELQSVNEELVTVNSEHEVKLDELSKSNNDMANLLASTEVGTIFLDNQLRIQRFTPAVTCVINLIQTDIGRPLSDIAISLVDTDLVRDVEMVLDTLTLKEAEVVTKNGHWYSVRIRSYRTTENVIEGAVVTFVDINVQKQAQEKLTKLEAEQRQRLATVIMDSNDAITLQDLDGNITAWNRGAQRMYGYTEAEALAMNIQDLVPKNKRQETLDFMKVIAGGELIESMKTQRLTKDGKILDVWLTITVIKDQAGMPLNVATTERDIGKLKQLLGAGQ